jgi:hypothetical protein
VDRSLFRRPVIFAWTQRQAQRIWPKRFAQIAGYRLTFVGSAIIGGAGFRRHEGGRFGSETRQFFHKLLVFFHPLDSLVVEPAGLNPVAQPMMSHRQEEPIETIAAARMQSNRFLESYSGFFPLASAIVDDA